MLYNCSEWGLKPFKQKILDFFYLWMKCYFEPDLCSESFDSVHKPNLNDSLMNLKLWSTFTFLWYIFCRRNPVSSQIREISPYFTNVTHLKVLFTPRMITSADPRLLGALRKTVFGVGCWNERLDEMHLSVFHSISNHAHGKRSRNSISFLAGYAFNLLFLVRVRDYTTFKSHDLAVFYVERVTAYHIQIND